MTARGASMGEAVNEAIVDDCAAGGPDVESIPDFDDAAVQWHENAAAYRRGQHQER